MAYCVAVVVFALAYQPVCLKLAHTSVPDVVLNPPLCRRQRELAHGEAIEATRMRDSESLFCSSPSDIPLNLFTFPRSVWLLAIATAANAAGVVAVLISVLVFQKTFKTALDRIPELPYELIAEGGGGATPLVSRARWCERHSAKT